VEGDVDKDAEEAAAEEEDTAVEAVDQEQKRQYHKRFLGTPMA
jgi:hypothetical protein